MIESVKVYYGRLSINIKWEIFFKDKIIQFYGDHRQHVLICIFLITFKSSTFFKVKIQYLLFSWHSVHVKGYKRSVNLPSSSMSSGLFCSCTVSAVTTTFSWLRDKCHFRCQSAFYLFPNQDLHFASHGRQLIALK